MSYQENKKALSHVKQVVKEMTCSMENEEYIEFLHELAEWADSEAYMTDYAINIDELEQ